MQTHSCLALILRTGVAVAAACLAGCASLYENGAAVTPQRPSFSSDPNTTAPGTFELEAGAALDPGDSFSVPMSLKYGAGERSEVFVGFSPINLVDRPGDDGQGFGDLLLGARHRYWENGEGTSAAVQFATKLPTADESEGLGSGELDFFVSTMLAHAVDDETTLLAYYEYGMLGDPASPSTDSQHLIALSASRSLQEKLGIYAELASFSGTDNGEPLITIVGATYLIASSFAVDVGASVGLNDDAPDLQLLVGLTINLGGSRN